MSTERETGMIDEHYDIVSALYHALQGAEASKKYISDAEQQGDQEAVEFFREVQNRNRETAEKAKALLAKKVH